MTSSKSPQPPSNLTALVTAQKLLGRQSQAEDLWPIVLGYLKEQLGMNLIWFSLYSDAHRSLIGQGGDTPIGQASFLKQKVSLAAGSLLDQVVMQRQPVTIPNLQEENRIGEWRQVAIRLNIQGSVIMPIVQGRECLGVALLGSSRWGEALRGEDLTYATLLFNALGSDLRRLQAQTPVEPPGKTASGSLVQLLQQFSHAGTLSQRIDLLLQDIHQHIQPVRTSLFWRDIDQPIYRRRTFTTGKPLGREAQRQPLTITQTELASFYSALMAGQIVAVSDAQGAVSSTTPVRLIQMLNTQALLAAPVIVGPDLTGFITLEMSKPHVWPENNKQDLKTACNLLSLAAPVERAEHQLLQTKESQGLLTDLTHAICQEQDWKRVLEQAGQDLANSVQASMVLLLIHEPISHRFTVQLQHPRSRGRITLEPFPPLSEMDWQLLEASAVAIALDDIQHELRLHSWKETFNKLGLRSLLFCQTTPGNPLEAVLIAGRTETSPWTRQEQNSLQQVAQCLGLLSHQWQLQRQSEQQQHLYNSMQTGLMAMQKTQNLDRLELTGLQNIMTLLQAPLVALVTWPPGQTTGWIVAPPPSHQRFGINTNVEINIYDDPLIHAALVSSQAGTEVDRYSGLISQTVEELDSRSRQWLSGPDIGQVLALALRTDPEYEPSGVLVVADRRDRLWSESHLESLVTLTNHLAWAHRSTCLLQVLTQGWQTLETLNWYKHRRVEELYQNIAKTSNQFNEWLRQRYDVADPLLKRWGREIQSQLEFLPKLLTEETWKLEFSQSSIGLAVLLKRNLDRLEPWVKKKQLWTQVHSQEVLTLHGDIPKIELILYEVLLAACQRSHSKGRIDIWCKRNPSEAKDTPDWLEISITDNGEIDPRLIIDLHHIDHLDWLAPSSLDHPPGRHLKSCFYVAQQLGGVLDMYKLEDERVLTRLILPLIAPETESV
ncbi:GAF domain-containing protein [Candidatus Synechococcus calcipolaris G9]|uniref:GAF domain-containing protein n=1 Tax=Candidatus Synechococcus calcipolaris G9 TaxID=1497997 RepID=A0ABT6EYB5_9SYNE|nr:GAF domain-containing protein [Candidatus Synechococcus calcipolaris]MDG2990794.1 GAF domain-containing protein [Candidatus Synechococcus calcipolaris G9]